MKYSIITAVYNGEKYISRLMASVFNQSYPNIEWIVQDGGSKDGTLDKLRPHADRIKLVSEPDSGVYDAWNRALDRATGDWAIFLGADDFFMALPGFPWVADLLMSFPEGTNEGYGPIFSDSRADRALVC